MIRYTADFETTTDENDCRVWAYGLFEIGGDNFIYGNNIDDFINWCMDKKQNYVLYYHNLKFDAEYILSYLLNNGYEFVKSKRDRRDKTFTCLISDMGQFYSLEIYFHCTKKHTNKVTIYDSLKILNFSVEKIAKDFNLPIQKLTLDYNKYRPVGHILTDDEIAYLRNDVEIMAQALKFMFDENLTKMTIGSDALANYKSMNKAFNRYFPVLPLEIDNEIRRSYKGGFTYLNEIYKEKVVGRGLVLDVNSLYPSVLKNERMPFGDPLFFEGKYGSDILYNLYVQTFSCSFELKEGMIPTLQVKNNPAFLPNEYIKTSDGDIITLTLTNIDMELFFKHYNVYDIVYHGGWKFKSLIGLFSNYVDHWTDKKIQAKKDNNKVMYTISKLLLNSLYGKFGLNPQTRSKIPYLEDGVVKYKITDIEYRDPIFLPIATFVTSYARRKTITTSQAIKDYTKEKYNKDFYLYSDTDSIHMLYMDHEELKQFVDIDDFRLGAWKIESEFKQAKFIRQKCYIEETEITEKEYNEGLKEKLNVYKKDDSYFLLNTTIAGLPKRLGKYITFDNFVKGFTIPEEDTEKEHKLRFKHVKGGVLLVDTDFTIK